MKRKTKNKNSKCKIQKKSYNNLATVVLAIIFMIFAYYCSDMQKIIAVSSVVSTGICVLNNQKKPILSTQNIRMISDVIEKLKHK